MKQKNELLKFCHKVYEKGFVAAYDGNLSIRLDQETILITPSGKNKGELNFSDLITADLNGNKLEGNGNVSSEIQIHLLVYKKRKEINSVIHCHPIYATAFSASGLGLNEKVFPEFVINFGEVPLCNYGTPSTEELPNSMIPFIDDYSALLLENHGAVTFGRNISEAYYRMEKLEQTSHTLFISKQIGGPNTLSTEQLKKIYRLKEKIYGNTS